MTLERWRQLAEAPLILAALAFLIAYSWRVLVNASGVGAVIATVVLAIVWIIFAGDYLVRLLLTPRGERGRWFRTHLFALASVALPGLRPLQLLRLVSALRFLHRSAGTMLRGQTILYAGGATVIVVYVAALAVLDSERHAPGASITSFGDALWWALVTVTSVGYGDYSPVTTSGRVIAVGLMIGGIALLSVVTATLASWMSDKVAGAAHEHRAATAGDVHRLEAKVDEVRALLDAGRR